MSQTDEYLESSARQAMDATGLPSTYWSIGERSGEGARLVRENGAWVAGYSERGEFDVKFREIDTGKAVRRFAAWVSEIVSSTEASVSATNRWLRREGKQRP